MSRRAIELTDSEMEAFVAAFYDKWEFGSEEGSQLPEGCVWDFDPDYVLKGDTIQEAAKNYYYENRVNYAETWIEDCDNRIYELENKEPEYDENPQEEIRVILKEKLKYEEIYEEETHEEPDCYEDPRCYGVETRILDEHMNEYNNKLERI